MTRRTLSPIDVMETAYELDSDEPTWLANVAKIHLLLDAGRRWGRVSAHLAAAGRLRASIRPVDGECRSIRELMRDAVLRQEAARSRKPDPDAAIEAWAALVSGRWTLVDRFERNGRRYVVAHRNELEVPDPRALTPRERVVSQLAALGKSNKLIAYELGLSNSTISTLLWTAMRKLGAETRPALIRLVRDLEG